MSIPENLAKAAAARSILSIEKIERAKATIEAEVRSGSLAATKVTIKLLIEKRAGLGERYLAGNGKKKQREAIYDWIEHLKAIKPTVDPSLEDRLRVLAEENQMLMEANRRLADRIHSYSHRLRVSNRIIRNLREQAEKSVVYIKRQT